MNLKTLALAAASIVIASPALAETNLKEDHEMEVKGVVESYFEYLQIGDLEGLENLFDDNIIWHQPGNGQLSGTYEGKPKLFTLFGEFMKRSGGTFKIDEVSSLMINGNFVIANLHFSATQGNKSISMDGVDLMKVKNGKIIEVHLFSADQEAEDEFWNQAE